MPAASPPASAVSAVAERQMIVVFPFENLGPPEDAYFAAGITDEITSRLGAVRSLGVISRTSAVQYDRTGKSMAQIRTDLGVSYVLEGTVRWQRSASAGSRVRVTPQLVDARRDTQIWSTTYEEPLDEIFRVQSQVAEQVIRQLDLTLHPRELQAVQSRSTDDLDAHQAYLRALHNRTSGYYDETQRRLTVQMLERAVNLDPDFALAWAALSVEHSYLYLLRMDATEERAALSRQAVDRALALQPDLPEAHLALGLFHYRCRRDYARALDAFKVAEQGLPNDADLINAVGAIRRRQGRWAESLERSQEALRLDPRGGVGWWNTAVTLLHMGRYDEAREHADRSIALLPDQPAPYGIKVLIAWNDTGDLAESRAILDSMPIRHNQFLDWMLFQQAIYEREPALALAEARSLPFEMFEGVIELKPKAQFEAEALALAGDVDGARRAYEAALAVLDDEAAERPEDARVHSGRGVVLAALGRAEEAVRAGRRGVELYPVSGDWFHGPAYVRYLATIHARNGDMNAALDLIESVLSESRTAHFPIGWVDPVWDPVRNDPRFIRLTGKK